FGTLRDKKFNTSVLDSCNNTLLVCDEPEFLEIFKQGADLLRYTVIEFDRNDLNILRQPRNGNAMLQASVLLADKYRSMIDYPISDSEHDNWLHAMFADWLVNYGRTTNLPQPDLGEYIKETSELSKGTNAHYVYPKTENDRRTFLIAADLGWQWTTTGWYALPGQSISLTRNDASQDIDVEIKLNYHQPRTNKAFEDRLYTGPLELMTQRIKLLPGKTVVFSSPYGGPIYLGANAQHEPKNVDVSAVGIAKHPSVPNGANDAEFDEFVKLFEETEIPHVDIDNGNTQLHMRKDRFIDADNFTADAVIKIARAVNDDLINPMYTLGGFAIKGKTLTESLPSDVLSVCTDIFGNADCVDEILHDRSKIQHGTFDQHATAGTGASGNPFTASWVFDPIGWGEAHEIGHNLQINKFGANYVDTLNADQWPAYTYRATENSNNIFPYWVKWRAHYINNENAPLIDDGHMNSKNLFFAFMSDVAKLKNSAGERVVLDQDCRLLNPGESRYEAGWKAGDNSAKNDYRMIFYIQMALRADRMKMRNGTILTNGFHLFTLLYEHSRIFDKYADNEAEWAANRDKLGFSLFPYSGHAVYGGNQIKDIPGNDFMLVALSQLTGYDWRSHFDLVGLHYSSLAVEQVAVNTTKGALPMGMYMLDWDMPPANMTAGLTFLPLSFSDNTTVWRDGSSPTQCAQ
uniref:ImpA family metalloprotease n=1 Tax=Aeromonas piscicola TaxID=600645 RepID=UPI0005B39F55